MQKNFSIDRFALIVLLAQTVLYLMSVIPFMHFTKEKFIFVLHNCPPKIRRYLQYVSLMWFATIILMNLSFVYAKNAVIKTTALFFLAFNAAMTYLLLYSIVKSSKDVEQLQKIVYVDSLTGLRNRTSMQMDGERLISQERPFTLIFMDLDHFKSVNDSGGHLAGDRYLAGFAQQMQELIGGGGTLYRISGDEFVCIYTEKDSTGLVKKIQKHPFAIEGGPSFLGVSLGVTSFPQDGALLENLLFRADQQMYEDKRRRHY